MSSSINETNFVQSVLVHVKPSPMKFQKVVAILCKGSTQARGPIRRSLDWQLQKTVIGAVTGNVVRNCLLTWFAYCCLRNFTFSHFFFIRLSDCLSWTIIDVPVLQPLMSNQINQIKSNLFHKCNTAPYRIARSDKFWSIMCGTARHNMH